MRPTFVQLIAGLGLGTALTVSLALPGRIVIADQAPVRRLALPRSAAHVVVEAARLRPAARPHTAPQRAFASASRAPRTGAVHVSYASRPNVVPPSAPRHQRVTQHPAKASPRTPPAQQTMQPLVAPSAATGDDAARPDKTKKVKKAKKPEKAKKVKEVKTKPDKASSKSEKKAEGEGKNDRKDARGDKKDEDEGRDGEHGRRHGKSRDE